MYFGCRIALGVAGRPIGAEKVENPLVEETTFNCMSGVIAAFHRSCLSLGMSQPGLFPESMADFG